MNNYVKYIYAAFGLIGSLLLIAFLIGFVPLNFLKPKLQKIISKESNYEVSIGNNKIFFKILPNIVIMIKDIKIHSPNNNDNNKFELSIDRLSIIPYLSSIISGRVKVKGYLADNAELKVLLKGDTKYIKQNNNFKAIKDLLEKPSSYIHSIKNIANSNKSTVTPGSLNESLSKFMSLNLAHAEESQADANRAPSTVVTSNDALVQTADTGSSASSVELDPNSSCYQYISPIPTSLAKLDLVAINNIKVTISTITSSNQIVANDVAQINKEEVIEEFFLKDLRFNQDKKEVYFNTHLRTYDNNYSINYTQEPSDNNHYKLSLAVKSGTFNLFLNGDKFYFAGNDVINGNVSLEILNISSFIRKVINNDFFVFRNIESGDPITLKGAFGYRDNKFFIKSRVDLDNLSGDFSIEKKSSQIVEAYVNISRLNIDHYTTRSVSTKQASNDLISDNFITKMEQKSRKLFGTLINGCNELKLTVSSDSVTLNNTSVKNVKISFVTNKDDIVVSEIAATLNKNNLKGYGKIKKDGEIYKFTGDIELDGTDFKELLSVTNSSSTDYLDYGKFNNYKLSSKLIIDNLNNVKLNDIQFKANNFIAEGYANFYLSDNDRSKELNLHFRNINIAQYLNYSSFIDQGSIQNSQKIDQEVLLYRFLLLNKLLYKGKIMLSFSDSYVNDEFIKNMEVKFNYERGYLNINNFTIEANSIKGRADFLIDIKTGQPEIKLSATLDNFDPSNLRKIFANNDENKQIQGRSGELIAQTNTQGIWDKNQYNMPSFIKFHGKLDINFNNIKYKDLQISNIIFSSDINDGIVSIDKFTGNLDSGKFDIAGSIDLRSVPGFSNSFAIVGIDVQKILSDLFDIHTISGIGNIKGRIKTFGFSPFQLATNLEGNIDLSGNNILIQHLDLVSLAKELLSPKGKKLKNLNIRDIINNGENMYFQNIKGNIYIDKGLAKVYNVSLTTPGVGGSVMANIDMTNLYLKLNSKFALAAYNPNDDDKPISLEIALTAEGNMATPKVAMNLQQIEQYIKGIGGDE